MKKNTNANEKNGLLDNPEQDKRTAESARMIHYTDQEIETLMNQPKLEPNQHEYR